VFGVLEALSNVAVASGAVLAAVLVPLVGPATVLFLAGALVLLVPALAFSALRHADDRAAVSPVIVDLLQHVPMFQPLALCTVEELAVSADHVDVEAGAALVREGEAGASFFVIEEGHFVVTVDGGVVRSLHAGDGFGEIALLKDVPRTATVRSQTGGRVLEIGREQFLGAVTGRAAALTAADALVRDRLGA
jgi:hypothetical protein